MTAFLHVDRWWVAILVVLGILIARRLMRRRALAISTLRLLGSSYRASRARHLPVLFVALSLAVVMAGVLDPVIPYSERQIEARGLDIVLVIDLSLSMYEQIGLKHGAGMLAAAPKPGESRIDAIKGALRTFISARTDDRIGLVVFSDNAYIVSPLTLDKEHLLGYFDMIDPNTLSGEGMTAIGEGVTMATFLLSRQSRTILRNKSIIVFTDGASNVGRDPVDALDETNAAGIQVHVVGIDLKEEQKRSPQVARFVGAVRRNGGSYFAADSRGELDAASRALDELEKGFLTAKTYVRNEPVVHWLALTALAVLLIGIAARALPVFVALH